MQTTTWKFQRFVLYRSSHVCDMMAGSAFYTQLRLAS
jgi:hypothetical protein